ncbi:MAG: hypothetical protein M1305_07975 [Candidatus Marsarchaeota archaeon]|nr:hypothetical protein [Candidatus Marsarchaeota archaeon]
MARATEPLSAEEFEDFAVAYFQTGGYFVEKNIKERNKHEVLELDAVATHYGHRLPEQSLIEVKSGDWGFPDIFKVLGWMTYLKIPRGAFIVSSLPKDKPLQFYIDKSKELNIELMVIDDLNKADTVFASSGFELECDRPTCDIWRSAFLIERRFLRCIQKSHKSNVSLDGPLEALKYYSLANDGIFFISDVRDRVSKLYDAYTNHPKLTLGAAAELCGERFDPEHADPDNACLKEAIFKGKHGLLQACMYLEHRARLSILRGAVDYLCEQKAEVRRSALSSSVFPSKFQESLLEIGRSPNFKSYPVFWQVFLWSWGGFILMDREEEEYAELSKQTGLPPKEIPDALGVYNSMFEIEQGDWFTILPKSQMKTVKMVPWPFMGLGVHQRLARHNLESVDELGYEDLTALDLKKRFDSYEKSLKCP